MDVQTNRFTVTEYERLADLNVLNPEKRTELIDGQIVEMTPKNAPHGSMVQLLTDLFYENRGTSFSIRVQDAMVLSEVSEPEPDIALYRYRADRYLRRKPRTEDVLLLIEVADSSLAYDRNRKAELYARAGIADYWIVNLVDRQVEVFRSLEDGRYAEAFPVIAGSVSPLFLPEIRLDLTTLFPEDIEG